MARTKPTGSGEGATIQGTAHNDGSDGHLIATTDGPSTYTVVARRYRPQRFEDVVGQDHVVQALRNAIRLNRVTHAYLFSGTRGVGKTSMARIFAKALNCVHGPTETPCNQCDICRSIAGGEDVDVIEIDGASNNGVDAVRELRQNAGLRPSRARFKIYYIDEVHMLSSGAFNALLKTLEEPPEHVKFLFATTEPNKIPITVLSRCQRFDFAGIAPEQIIDSLASICGQEGIEADREALQAVARRAGGSMRDAQSLLEQLLAFGGERLTSELVHQALGMAPDDRVLDLIDALADKEPAKVLSLLNTSMSSGIQPVDLLNGVLEFLRDLMVVAAGAELDTLAASPGQRVHLRKIADRWGLDAILASMQILAEARGRLRGSPHGRLLVELAFCRVARLEDFGEIRELIEQLAGSETGSWPASSKKKVNTSDEDPAAPTRQPSPSTRPDEIRTPRFSPGSSLVRSNSTTSPEVDQASKPLELPNLEAARRVWANLSERVGSTLGVGLRVLNPTAIEPPGILVVPVPSGYHWIMERCGELSARTRIEEHLRELLGTSLILRFELERDSVPENEALATQSRAQRSDELAVDPFVMQVSELFEARRVRVEFEDDRSEDAS